MQQAFQRCRVFVCPKPHGRFQCLRGFQAMYVEVRTQSRPQFLQRNALIYGVHSFS